jgi:hypothetical protein
MRGTDPYRCSDPVKKMMWIREKPKKKFSKCKKNKA